ncbi:MAG: hypothetical protein HVK41_05755 [Pelagibacteraceae bacterium]|jgi:hypothetical protein|nr:hypothetical protein [Pelagibacteraceae bacterium]MBO6470978.1 hypothetical protein [Pelagibacteraceae bacterium]
MNIFIKSKKHYDKANESYFKHMIFALVVSFNLLKTSLMAAIHSVIPALFEKGASKKIIELYEYLKLKKRIDQ